MINVFVSHAHNEKKLAEEIKQELESIGATADLLTYTLDPEKTVIEKIKQGIQTCDLGIILWTKNSQNREWVLQEIGALSILNKPVVIFLEENVNPPSGLVEGKHYLRLNDETSIGKLKSWALTEIQKKSVQYWVGIVTLVLVVGIGIAGALYLLLKK